MNNYKNDKIDYTDSSCFVGYLDYTTTSLSNFNNIFSIVSNNEYFEILNPNSDTILAIHEARNSNLKEYDNVDDFFDDLES